MRLIAEIHCIYHGFRKSDFMALPNHSWLLSNTYGFDMHPVVQVQIPESVEAREELWRQIRNKVAGRKVSNFLVEQHLVNEVKRLLDIFYTQFPDEEANA